MATHKKYLPARAAKAAGFNDRAVGVLGDCMWGCVGPSVLGGPIPFNQVFDMVGGLSRYFNFFS